MAVLVGSRQAESIAFARDMNDLSVMEYAV